MTTEYLTREILDYKYKGIYECETVEEAMFILADGSLWAVEYDYLGERLPLYKDAERFSKYSYEDTANFNRDITVRLGLVHVEPEQMEIRLHPEQRTTPEQDKVIGQAYNSFFAVRDL